MKHVQVFVLNAFAENGKGGNPAGVVPDADDLDQNQKQEIARKAGYSETAFVSSSTLADFKVEFFTPVRQIAHCGHATVATFSFLMQTNRVQGNHSSKETIDGIRQIIFEGDLVFMEQQKPTFPAMEMPDVLRALTALGIDRSALPEDLEPHIVNTGNSFLIVPVKDEHILAVLKPNMDMINTLSEQYGLVGFYPFASVQEENAVASARMFAPLYGIPEESATGMAAGPLAAYLDRYLSMRQEQMPIVQGRFMDPPSPSRILVRMERENGVIQRLFAGGSACLAKEIGLSI